MITEVQVLDNDGTLVGSITIPTGGKVVVQDSIGDICIEVKNDADIPAVGIIVDIFDGEIDYNETMTYDYADRNPGDEEIEKEK